MAAIDGSAFVCLEVMGAAIKWTALNSGTGIGNWTWAIRLMPITQVVEPAACMRTGCHSARQVTSSLQPSTSWASCVKRVRRESPVPTRLELGRTGSQRFQTALSCDTGSSPSKQRTLDTLVSSTSPSLAKQIHAVSDSVVNPSHCSVSFTGDLHLVTSDVVDLVNVRKTRKHRNEAFYYASLRGQQG